MKNFFRIFKSKKQLTIQSLNDQDINTPFFSLEGYNTYGKVVDVYDGDTCKVVIPLFNNYYKFNIRIAGIDTPEIRTKDLEEKERAYEAKGAALEYLLGRELTDNEIKNDNNLYTANNIIVKVECLEFDKYGRLLARIYNLNRPSMDLSSYLVLNGYAKSYDGGTKN